MHALDKFFESAVRFMSAVRFRWSVGFRPTLS